MGMRRPAGLLLVVRAESVAVAVNAVVGNAVGVG